MKNLVIAVLGNRNSGKSSTWNELFQRTVRTGSEQKQLYINKSEFVDVFLVSGSPEERGAYVGDIIGDIKPRIVLCSMQYKSDVRSTIDYFVDNDYLIYCHWLNPGFTDSYDVPIIDSLGLINYIITKGGVVAMRNGKSEIRSRVREIREFIMGWASQRRLLKNDD